MYKSWTQNDLCPWSRAGLYIVLRISRISCWLALRWCYAYVCALTQFSVHRPYVPQICFWGVVLTSQCYSLLYQVRVLAKCLHMAWLECFVPRWELLLLGAGGSFWTHLWCGSTPEVCSPQDLGKGAIFWAWGTAWALVQEEQLKQAVPPLGRSFVIGWMAEMEVSAPKNMVGSHQSTLEPHWAGTQSSLAGREEGGLTSALLSDDLHLWVPHDCAMFPLE